MHANNGLILDLDGKITLRTDHTLTTLVLLAIR